MKHKYSMNVKEKILFVLTQLFFIAIIFPLNDVFAGIIVGSMMLCCLLFNSFSAKLTLLKERKYIILMVSFFAWIFISVLISKDRQRGFGELDPRLPFLYFPVTIGLLYLQKEFKQRVLIGFAVVVSAFCLLSLLQGIYKYHETGNIDYFYNDGLTYYADRSATYISALVTISIFILFREIYFRTTRYKAIFIAITFFLLTMMFLLAARNMLLVLLAVIVGFLLHQVIKHKRYFAGLALLAGLVVVGFLSVTFFPKILNRFTDLKYLGYDYSHVGTESHYTKATDSTQWNGANFRLAAWKCGWELFKEHPIMGVHIGDKKAKLIEKYKEKNFQFVITDYKNVHNNYLDILFGTGIIGLFLFLIGWLLLPLRRCIKFNDYLSVLIIGAFAIATITEVYFDRSLGGMLFGFLTPFLLTDHKQE